MRPTGPSRLPSLTSSPPPAAPQLEDFDPQWESREKGECEALRLVSAPPGARQPGRAVGTGFARACARAQGMARAGRGLVHSSPVLSPSWPSPPPALMEPLVQEIAELTVRQERAQRAADATERKRGALLAQAAALKEVRRGGEGAAAAIAAAAAPPVHAPTPRTHPPRRTTSHHLPAARHPCRPPRAWRASWRTCGPRWTRWRRT